MQGNDRQAYDRGTSLFSPDGRIYQVEYAHEAVKKGSPSVGIRAADAVVLAAERPVRSPLLEPRSVEKLHKIDDHIAVASAGHVADARQLVDVGRRVAQIEQLRYEEPVSTEQLTTEISEHIQEYTQAGGTRPFGAALLVGGYVDEPRLFETDPSGTSYEWRANAIGGGSNEIRATLEDEYDPEMTADDALGLAARVLTDDDQDDDTEDVTAAVSIIDEDGYRALSDEEVADHL